MADEKRVIVLGQDDYSGLNVEAGLEDIVVVMRDYAGGRQAIDGLNLDYPGAVEELEKNGLVVMRNVEMGRQGDGTPIMGDDAFYPFVVSRFGLSRPGLYPCEMNDAEKAEMDAIFEQYAKRF